MRAHVVKTTWELVPWNHAIFFVLQQVRTAVMTAVVAIAAANAPQAAAAAALRRSGDETVARGCKL